MTKNPTLGIQLSKEEFDNLGVDLCAMITSAEQARDALGPRWEKVTSYYNNEPLRDSWRWLKRYKLQHFPLIQPKVDQLCAVLTTSIFSQARTFLARQAIGGSRVQPVEDLLQFFLDQGFEDAVDQMAPVACNTNHGAIYVPFEVRSFQSGKEPVGFGFYGIAPGDFITYPSHARNLEECIAVGHRKTMTLEQVEHLQSRNYFRKVPVTGGHNPSAEGAGMGHEQRTDNTPSKPGHTPVKIYVLECEKIIPGQNEPKRYYAVVAFDTQQVLRLDEFPFRYSRYIDLRVKPPQYGGYWSATSVGQDLQSLQWQYNQLSNLLVAGQWMQAFPWFITDGKVDKAQELSPMSGLQVNGQTTFPQLSFNAGEIPFMLQQIKNDADAVTRVTQEATGVAISKRQTLGEMQMRQAGASKGLEKFLQTFGNSLSKICYTMQEQLAFHYEIWAQMYREQAVALGDPMQLEAFLCWSPQGKTPDTTSNEILEKLAYIEQMAEKDIQESMALGFDPSFDIGKVRKGIANTLRPPNVQDYFFNPQDPSPAMQGIIAGTIQAKAEEMAVQMAEEMMGQQEGVEQQLEMQFDQEREAADMKHETEIHKRDMKDELEERKTATALHKKDLQIEAMKKRVEARKASERTKATNGKAK